MLRAAVLVLLSAVIVVAVSGCGDPPKTVTTQTLDGTDWASASIDGRELVKGSKLTLAFENDLLSASAGCNSINGKYTVTGGVLKQSDQFQTMMSCGVGTDAQERWFADFLAKGANATLQENTLTLTGGGVKVVFTRAEPSGPPPVVGTAWTLVATAKAGKDDIPVAGAKPPTLTLTEDGKAEIFTGCNRGAATAVFADGFVTFGPIGLTRMACDPAAMELEAMVIQVLDGKVAAGFSGEDELSLAKDGDRLLYAAR